MSRYVSVCYVTYERGMDMTNTRTTAAKAGVVLLWVVTVLEALLMAVAGSAKFTRPDTWSGMFVDWGYPLAFTWVIGAVELGFAVLLLVPRLAAWAGIVLIVVMLGALATVIVHDSPLGVTGPIVHMVALGIVVAGRWRDRLRPRYGADSSTT